MPSTMPFKSAPGISPGKAKLSAEIAQSVKKNNRVSFDITLEKKIIDGKTMTVCRQNSYCCYPINQASPLTEEFTDVKKFAKAIHDQIVSVGETL